MYTKKLLKFFTVLLLISLSMGACQTAPPEPERIVETVVVEVAGETVVQTVEVEVEKEVQVEVTPTAAPRPEGITAIVPFISDEDAPESVALHRKIIEEYEAEHPDVDIDLVLIPHGSEMTRRIITSMAVGADAGMTLVEESTLPDFVAAGWLLPIDDVVDNIGRENFKPQSILEMDGHVYAIGYSGGTNSSLWIRKDLLDEAGLEPPTNYEELLEVAEALTQDTDGDGNIDIYGIGLPAGPGLATTSRFAAFLYQNCGDWYDRQGNVAFNNENAKKAIEQYVELMQYSPPDSAAWGWGEGIDAFIAGRVAMHPYGGRLGAQEFNAAPELRANTIVVPWVVGDYAPEGAPATGRGSWDYIAITSSVKFPEEAKDFLTFYFESDAIPRLMMSVPGHILAPTVGAEDEFWALQEAEPNEYVTLYEDDVRTLFELGQFEGEPSVTMGFVDTNACSFKWVYNPVPWGGTLWAASPTVDAAMLQKILVEGASVDEAWQWEVDELQRIADEWKADHPDWTAEAP
jgi:ABC-type glycerol-3-phosphate transport system substrate-binding protein